MIELCENDILLSIKKEDIEEVINLIRYSIVNQPTSNNVWTLLANFCEENSSIKYDGKEEEFIKDFWIK